MAYYFPLKKNLFFLAFFSLLTHLSFCQGTVADDTLGMSLFQVTGGVHEPFGDMGDMYGTYASVGFSFAVKTKKKLVLGF